MNGNKNNPQDVNLFIEQQTALLLGMEVMPVIGSTGTATAPEGTCFYYLQADGAANVVISAMTGLKGGSISIGGTLTVLAGGTLPLNAVKSFVVDSGKYIVVLRNI